MTSALDNGGTNPPVGAGTGTLRQAIVDANANCASDPNPIIQFAIGASPTFIGIGSPAATTTNPLPPLQCATTYSPTLDGTTQPGSVPNSDPTGNNGVLGIEIDATNLLATGPTCGINFAQPIGVGGSLTVRGIRFRAFTASGQGAGICGTNMQIYGSEFESNTAGVKVVSGGTAIIGDLSPATRNTMSFNTYGVEISGANTVNVVNNFIGVRRDGNTPGANSIGIFATNTPAINFQDNVISGNSAEGIRLFGVGGQIFSNKIGISSLGASVPNTTGIRTDNASGPIQVGLNTITNNTQYGMHVASGVGFRHGNNRTWANGVKNVTLDMYGGPVINDFQDPDIGPNQRQNHPIVTSVTPSGGSVQVTFTLNSTPNTPFTVGFFSNSGPGIPAGENVLFFTSVTTDANGDVPPTSFLVGAGVDYVSMLASDDLTNNTSEFSPIVALTTVPGVTVSPPNLTFGNVTINTTSPAQTTTLTSSGSAPYQISQLGTGSCYGGPICYGGAEFTCSTNCVPFNNYNPGASCSITANFAPTILGPQTMNLVVCDNATGSPRTITLTGNGVAGPVLSVTPSFFDFGDVPVGTRSARAIFRLQNPNPSPLAFTAGTNGPFAIVGTNCANPIPASGACDYDVAFDPVAAGTTSGTFAVQTASSPPSTASLLGNGILAPALAMPGAVDIPYTLGGPAATQAVTLANAGGLPLVIDSVAITGEGFTLVNNCPATLPPGSSCNLVIGFSASTLGTFNGTLTVMTNAPGGSRSIPMRGLSQPDARPIVEITPREIGFGDRALGTTSAGETVKIRNVGGAPVVFDSLVASPDFVILEHTCRAPLASLDSCEAKVAIRPNGYGVRFGKFRVLSNAVNSPNEVQIFGTSCRASSLVLPRMGTARGC